MFFCILLIFPVFAQETITLSTYYPAPFGVYQEIIVHGRMAIGDVNGDKVVDANDLGVDGSGGPLLGSLTVANNIGIGTGEPEVALEVQGDSWGPTNRGQIQVGSSTFAGKIGFRRGGDGAAVGTLGWGGPTENHLFILSNASGGGELRFNVAPSEGNITFYEGNATQNVKIANDGNMRIGSGDPRAKLDVEGGIKIGDTSSCNSNRGGTVRYRDNNIEYCDATDWQSLSSRLYSYHGATANKYKGGEVNGYDGGDAKCQAVFGSSTRMCSAADFANGRPTKTGWYSTFIVQSDSSAGVSYTRDCRGWKYSGSSAMGAWWQTASGEHHGPNRNICNVNSKILCCK